MAHVITELDTTASPERVIGALTDFSPRRLELWPNIDRRYYKVESTEPTSAEVTEGTGPFGGIWERARYDWSRPGTVRIDVKDSNAFEPGSYWKYDVTPTANGGSHVRMEFDRRPRNFRGRVASALLDRIGGKFFEKQLGETLRRIERAS
ncbi:SRPBCC family protein [Sandaracinus amylolyticus]|uniref:SRPBCC family protein n=1 Tax=Sandaracinus amylolyticus TaxID=927083 RepID=UPI001F3373DF|nr:SRPBCC family protein [Sandaracinus amylolyticus]UJR84521.1 Hypothetical protein I5071_66000 [Sandaracinus amylolyticus]